MTSTDTATETEPSISDEELTELALSASADDVVVDEDAVPWRSGDGLEPLIGDWYMPAPVAARHDWRSRLVAGVIVASIVAINAAGLCVTYGRVILG